MAVAVPIILGLLLIMFIFSIPILSINIPLLVIQIKKIKKKIKFNKIIFCLSIIGTVFGLCLFSPPVFLITTIRLGNLRNNPKIVKADITISWQKDDGGEGDSFLYNNKEYKYFNITAPIGRLDKIEVDKPIANIKSKKNSTKIYNFLIGINSTKTLYTLKNIDNVILTTVNEFNKFTLYCDSGFIDQKTSFYSSIDNYLLYFTRNTTDKSYYSKSIKTNNYERIAEIASYKGEEIDLAMNTNKFINIFGISRDGLLIKDIAVIIIDDNALYRREYRDNNIIHVTKLDNSLKDFVLSLIE